MMAVSDREQETIPGYEADRRRHSPTIDSAQANRVASSAQPLDVVHQRIVLAGGGLPHLHCLRAASRAPLGGASVTVVAPAAQIVYSGMLPGWVAGHYSLDECLVPIAALARRAGATFVCRSVEHVDAAQRSIALDDGAMLDFDVLSLAVGSVIDTHAIRGAEAHAIAVRPLEAFARRWDAFASTVNDRDRRQVVVIGAGPGGVEIALAVRHRLGRSVGVTVVSSTNVLPAGSRTRLQRCMHAAGIVVHSNARALAIDERGVRLDDGTQVPADVALVATGSAAPRWLAASGLPVAPDGYVKVEPTLQVMAHRGIFASGDCASIAGHPQPRSGVHALRMGPTLLENLRRSLAGDALTRYSPRQRALYLMSTGDRYAVGSWGGVAFEGRWAWRWKNRIDRAFIARHAARDD